MPKDSDTGKPDTSSDMSDEFARLIVEHAEDAIVFTDKAGLVKWCNNAFSRQTGYELHEILGRKPGSFLQGPDTDPETVAEISAAIRNCEQVTKQIVNYTKSGVSFWIDMTIIPIHDKSGGLVHFMSTQREVTDRVRLIADLEAALAREEKRKAERQALQSMTEWLTLADNEEEVAALLGRTIQVLLPSTSGALYLWDDTGVVLTRFAGWGASAYADDLEPQMCWALRRGRAYHFGASKLDLVCPHVADDAQGRDPHHFCIPIFSHGNAMGLLHMELSGPGTEVSDSQANGTEHDLWSLALMAAEQIGLSLAKIKLQNRLQEETLRDPLTGLRNRRWFEQRAAIRIRRELKQKRPLSLICLDLDHFKKFNDMHGHVAGDEALRTMGATLCTHFPSSTIACRIGGEEFILICLDASASEAKCLADDFQDELRSLTISTAAGTVSMVSFSAGVAERAGEDDMQTLYRRADEALYTAKNSGRRCVMIAGDSSRGSPRES